MATKKSHRGTTATDAPAPAALPDGLADRALLEQITRRIQAREADRSAARERRRQEEVGGRRQRAEALAAMAVDIARRIGVQPKPAPAKAAKAGDLSAEREHRRRADCAWLRQVSRVPKRYVDVDLRRCPACLPREYHAAAGKLLGMLEAPQLMAIGGEVRTGKTALACGLVHAFCDDGRSAVYVRASMYLDELGDAPFGAGAKQRIRDKYAAPELLVLDEIQTVPAGQGWIDELEKLIDARYANEAATLIVGNLTAKSLREMVGAKVWGRIIEEGGFREAAWERVHPLLQKADLAQ